MKVLMDDYTLRYFRGTFYMQMEEPKTCAKLSPHCESKDVIQQDCSCCSSGDECLDDIKADLISLTLSDSNCSIVNFDTKNLSVKSTPKTEFDNSPVHTTKDAESDSFLVNFSCPSEHSSISSSTETLTQNSGVQLHEACNISIQKLMRDSETVDNKNEKLILSTTKHVALQQDISTQNVHGFTQPHITGVKKTSFSKCKLSLSLHDVSRLPDFPLKHESRDFSSDTIPSQSMTTISLGLKSKDSGLPSSQSCLSLSSSGRGYGHVQSKVKEYIRQIKEADERRKPLKSGDISNENVQADLSYVSDENNSIASEKTLVAVIRDLQYELQDKETVLLKLQDNYDKLLIKYGEAQNRIDQLRFKVIDPSLELSTHSQEQNHNFSNPGGLILNSTNKFTSPCDRTLCMSAGDESPPFDVSGSLFKRIRASNDKTTSHKKPRSSRAQFVERHRRHNLALNPLVKHCSSSVRLDKKVEPLSQISSATTTEESFEKELSLSSRMSKRLPSSERTYGSPVVQPSKMCTDEHLGSATSSYKNYGCQCMESAVTAHGGRCDSGKSCEDMCEFCFSHSKQWKKIPVVSGIKIPEGKNGEGTLLRKKSLEHSESDHVHNTLFEKVSRWQESLPPPLELIEPGCCESLDCHSSGSEISSQNFMKNFAFFDGRDSGCPHSELHSFSVQPKAIKFSASHASKCKTNLTEAKNIFLRTELVTVGEPTHQKGAFLLLPCKSTISSDGRPLDNGELCLPHSLKPSECSRSTVKRKPLNIDSCECWNLDADLSSASLESCDQKQKKTFHDFHVPPLKLGSLLDGDDDIDSNTNGANNMYSSDVSTVPETEGMSKAHLYYSSEENLSSSHQCLSESITDSSSTYVASDSQASKPLNDVKFSTNKMYPHLSNDYVIDTQQRVKTSGRKSERKQYNNVHLLRDDALGRRMNHTNIQNDSLQASATTSTSYRSIQPYKRREMKGVLTQQYCGAECSHLAQTSDCAISSTGNILVHTEGHDEFSDHHAIEQTESHTLRRKLLGLALRRLLLEFLSTDNCLYNSCICHKSSRKLVAPKYHIHHTPIGNENTAANSDSHTSTHVHCTSVSSDIGCGAKRTLLTDKALNNVVEDSSPKDSISGRYSGSLVIDIRPETKDSPLGPSLFHKNLIVPSATDNTLTNDANSTIISQDESLEKVKYNVMKCLHEIDQCAQQLKVRSEAVLNILAVKMKSSY